MCNGTSLLEGRADEVWTNCKWSVRKAIIPKIWNLKTNKQTKISASEQGHSTYRSVNNRRLEMCAAENIKEVSPSPHHLLGCSCIMSFCNEVVTVNRAPWIPLRALTTQSRPENGVLATSNLPSKIRSEIRSKLGHRWDWSWSDSINLH